MPQRPILIVEDTADIRDTLRMALELEGYEVRAASHGADALEQLEAGLDPGLILLDLFMPVMGGEAFLAERAARGVATGTPVVVFAATVQDREIDGVVDWITKPVDIDSLFVTVRRWFAG